MIMKFVFMSVIYFFTCLLYSTLIDCKLPHNFGKEKHFNDVQTDSLVEEILTWIQKTYTDKNRKIREEYVNERKPRPFQNVIDDISVNGYPLSGFTPKVAFEERTTNPPTRLDEDDNQSLSTDTPDSIRVTDNAPQKVSLFENENISNNQLPKSNQIIDTVNSLQQPIDINRLIDNVPDDDNHPPHVHKITGQCSKNMMTVNLEFNKEFNGIVYSKDFLNNEDCRFISPNSNRKSFEFTIEVNKCGTTFHDKFETDSLSYLENLLVFQSEPNVQEEWDFIRSVRCLLKRSYTRDVNSQLSIATLKNDVLNFTGDTAMVYLDIKQGKDPLDAPVDSSMIQIGQSMMLTLTLIGDNDFDIFVKKCRATSYNSPYSFDITDDNGCVLKTKFFGAFQTLRNPKRDTNEYSVIKYSHFKAFKFPDSSDVQFDCNVELCKVNCEQVDQCPNGDQIYPTNRKKRFVANAEVSNLRKSIKVHADPGNRTFQEVFVHNLVTYFLVALVILVIFILISISIFTSITYLKRVVSSKFDFLKV